MTPSFNHVGVLLYGVWRLLPSQVKHLLIYMGTPKVTVGVSAVILDVQGRLLVVRHTYRSPAWGLPSGLVQRNELATAALRRELHEELGLTATVHSLLHADHEPRRHLLTLHYQVAVAGTPRHGVETDGHHYAALDELAGLVGWEAPSWLREAVSCEKRGEGRALCPTHRT